MSRRTKFLLLIVLLGFGGFYLLGLRDTRELATEAGRHGAIALSGAIHVLACVLGVMVMRADRFSAGETGQFFLVLGATVLFALLLVGVQALLSKEPVLSVLLDGLPKLALIVPVKWILQQEKLVRAARENSAPGVQGR